MRRPGTLRALALAVERGVVERGGGAGGELHGDAQVALV